MHRPVALLAQNGGHGYHTNLRSPVASGSSGASASATFVYLMIVTAGAGGLQQLDGLVALAPGMVTVPMFVQAVRGGCVPAWAQRIADLLHVMPQLAVYPDGRVSVGGALFGRRNMTAKFARFVSPSHRAREQRWTLAVGHANAPAEAAKLTRLLRDGLDNIDEAFVVPIGTALGVHGGPGCLVVSIQETWKPAA